MSIDIRFPGCTVRVFPEERRLETIFPDGRTVPACPEDNDEYRKTAREHGYGEDTFRLSLHHELLHTMLAEFIGLSYSPTLRAVAEGREGDACEEEQVMRFQKRLMEVSRRIPCW
jgi:hypothetical protein